MKILLTVLCGVIITFNILFGGQFVSSVADKHFWIIPVWWVISLIIGWAAGFVVTWIWRKK